MAAEALAHSVSILAIEWRDTNFDEAREAFIDAARHDLALPQYEKVTTTRAILPSSRTDPSADGRPSVPVQQNSDH